MGRPRIQDHAAVCPHGCCQRTAKYRKYYRELSRKRNLPAKLAKAKAKVQRLEKLKASL